MGMPFQFTHSGRGATYRQGSPCTRRCRFNSRTLGRVRHAPYGVLRTSLMFQFTHPGKGATDERRSIERLGTSFNSRTLGRVRRRRSPLLTTPHDVSIHAPWEGCDQAYLRTAPYYREFQFTHPGRGATQFCYFFVLWLWFQFTHPGRGWLVYTSDAADETIEV